MAFQCFSEIVCMISNVKLCHQRVSFSEVKALGMEESSRRVVILKDITDEWQYFNLNGMMGLYRVRGSWY